MIAFPKLLTTKQICYFDWHCLSLSMIVEYLKLISAKLCGSTSACFGDSRSRLPSLPMVSIAHGFWSLQVSFTHAYMASCHAISHYIQHVATSNHLCLRSSSCFSSAGNRLWISLPCNTILSQMLAVFPRNVSKFNFPCSFPS